MATKEMIIKLMIDPESDRLIFAEASKDFVDFLVYLLSLPIGTVTKLLTNESMVGSIGNIYTSVLNLDETYLLRPDVNRNVLLDPMVFPSAISTPLPAAATRKLYTCWDPKCKRRGISDVRNEFQCPECHGDIYLEVQFIDKDSSEGYVHGAASYMISDDLSITSISTMSIMSMMNKFNVTKPEERVVKIGTEEALEVLKASLRSTTVLTDVFLKRNKRKQPTAAEAEAEGEGGGLYRVVKSSIDNGMKEIRAVLDLQHDEIRQVLLSEAGAEDRRVLAEHGAILDELKEMLRGLIG